MKRLDCRYFNGYKPCGKSEACSGDCPSYQKVRSRILVVHLEALGAVLRGTSILAAIRRIYPGSHITWVTKSPAHELLKHNPLVDRIFTISQQDLLALETLNFDVGFCVDKSQAASGVIGRVSIDQVFGFKVDGETGAIVPATIHSNYLWNLGLSNYQKFFVNKKPETQLMIEAFNLGQYQRDEYVLRLNSMEQDEARQRRKEWSPHGRQIIGVNTGCSSVISYKKLTVEGHRRLIKKIQNRFPLNPIVLLGGPEDTQRNREIADGLDIIVSDSDQGIRDGLVSMNACDIVISGDSLGMHMAIGLKKWVVAWFGPTCDHEIDLYERGVKIKAKVECSPCWKRHCDKSVMCYDHVDFDEFINSVEKGIRWHSLLSKQPSWEMSSLVYPC